MRKYVDLNNTAWLGRYNAVARTFIFEADGTLSYRSSTSKVAKGLKNRGFWRLEGNNLFFEHYISPNSKLMEFRGTGREYFRVWLVNVMLTLLTLGLYGPWAKVRTRRYFHGVTSLAGYSFEYHAAPTRILMGRAVVAGMLFAGLVSLQLGRWAVVAWAVMAVATFPLLVRQAIRFNARNTSWRGVRFNFFARYREAVLACVVCPVAGLLTLFLSRRRGVWDRPHQSPEASTDACSGPNIGSADVRDLRHRLRADRGRAGR